MLERRVRTAKYLVFEPAKPLKTKGNGWTKKKPLPRSDFESFMQPDGGVRFLGSFL